MMGQRTRIVTALVMVEASLVLAASSAGAGPRGSRPALSTQDAERQRFFCRVSERDLPASSTPAWAGDGYGLAAAAVPTATQTAFEAAGRTPLLENHSHVGGRVQTKEVRAPHDGRGAAHTRSKHL